MMRTNILLFVASLAGLLLVSAGCGAGGDRMKTHPVSGSVLADGKPAGGARLVFHPTEEQPAVIPTARVAENGSYQVTSFELFDGAPPGEYRVTLTWPSPKPAGAAVDEPEGPDQLKGRYGKMEDSPWKITVRAGKNELQPMRLQLESDRPQG